MSFVQWVFVGGVSAAAVVDDQGSVAAEISYEVCHMSEYNVIDQVADRFNDVEIGVK